MLTFFAVFGFAFGLAAFLILPWYVRATVEDAQARMRIEADKALTDALNKRLEKLGGHLYKLGREQVERLDQQDAALSARIDQELQALRQQVELGAWEPSAPDTAGQPILGLGSRPQA